MIRLRHKLLIHIFRIFDPCLMLLLTALAIFLFGHYHEGLKWTALMMPHNLAIIFLMGISAVFIFNAFVRYRGDRFVSLQLQLRTVFKSTTTCAFVLFVLATIFRSAELTKFGIFLFWIAASICGILSRVLMHILLVNARQSGYNYRYLLIVGTNQRSANLANRIQGHPELGYKLVGFVSEEETSPEGWDDDYSGSKRVVGQVSQLPDILEKEQVDEMMVCLNLENHFSAITKVGLYARDLGIVLRIIPDSFYTSVFERMQLEEFHGDHVITLFRDRMLIQILLKRILDVVVSSFALLLLSPLMIGVAIAIKLTSRGPVFFSQNRVGMNQRKFRLYKFRSMVIDAEEKKKELMALNEQDGCAFKMKDDPRVTKVGAFIRRTSIDELPQLLNVLRGEMSLVGPRPSLPDEVSRYQWNFRRRLSVKPGITCFWQISGRNNVSFSRWVEMDKDYIDNWSILLDLKILLRTIPAVLSQKGAS